MSSSPVYRGHVPFQAGWISITGPVRNHNEDAVGVCERAEAALFAIADGVGGAEAGEYVSAFCIQYVISAFHDSLDTHWGTLLRDALDSINAEVRGFSEDISARAGTDLRAGSTFTGIVIEGWNATVAHVGDSRLYRCRNGVILQLTEDHSRAPDDDPNALKHNVLLKGIGRDDHLQPDVFMIDLQVGDRLLLCSDGMSDRLSDDEIGHALANKEAAEAAEFLAYQADASGVPDNISVIVIHISEGAPSRVKPQPRAYVGYDPRWQLALGRQVPLRTGEVSALTLDENTRKQRWLMLGGGGVLLVILAVVVLSWLGTNAVGAAPTPTPTPTETVAPTPTATLTITPSPTPMPTFTATALPSNTPLPTATLREA